MFENIQFIPQQIQEILIPFYSYHYNKRKWKQTVVNWVFMGHSMQHFFGHCFVSVLMSTQEDDNSEGGLEKIDNLMGLIIKSLIVRFCTFVVVENFVAVFLRQLGAIFLYFLWPAYRYETLHQIPFNEEEGKGKIILLTLNNLTLVYLYPTLYIRLNY